MYRTTALVSSLIASACALALLVYPSDARAEAPAPAPARAPPGEHAEHVEDAESGEPGEPGEHGEHGEHGEGHAEHHNHYFVGANLTGLVGIHNGATSGAYGVGGFFELTAVPTWLEIEVGAHLLRTEGHFEVPVDLLFKMPFHINPVVHPYFGLGPTAVFGGADAPVHAGLATVLGSYFWVTHHVGVSAEINYNIVSGDGIVHEVGGTAGVVYGW